MKQEIIERTVHSFMSTYYENLTDMIGIEDSECNTVEIPRRSLDDHLIYFGKALLKHMESPKWIIRGYQSAKGFEIKFCGGNIAPVMGVCSSFLKNPAYYLDEKQLEDWEIVVFGPDHKIGANIFDFVKRGKEALDEQGRLHGGYSNSLANGEADPQEMDGLPLR